MASILDRIIATKRAQDVRKKARLPPELMAKLAEQRAQSGEDSPRDFFGAVQGSRGPHVIAEVKRASPSKGVLRPPQSLPAFNPVQIAQGYESAGAKCVSVLTDVEYFWGNPEYIGAVRDGCSLPVLRKDFILDSYGVDETCWLGADAVLLMASVMSEDSLIACVQRADELGLSCLVEVHSDEELYPVLAAVEYSDRALLGINHRDLHSLELDMQRALRLREKIPPHLTVVAESGLRHGDDLAALMAVGIETFLIGGHLCAADSPQQALQKLLEQTH